MYLVLFLSLCWWWCATIHHHCEWWWVEPAESRLLMALVCLIDARRSSVSRRVDEVCIEQQRTRRGGSVWFSFEALIYTENNTVKYRRGISPNPLISLKMKLRREKSSAFLPLLGGPLLLTDNRFPFFLFCYHIYFSTRFLRLGWKKKSRSL